MKKFIDIMLKGLESVFMSTVSIVCFILAFEALKLVINATGFAAIGYFLIAIFLLTAGLFIVACIGITEYDSDKTIKNVEGENNGSTDN